MSQLSRSLRLPVGFSPSLPLPACFRGALLPAPRHPASPLGQRARLAVPSARHQARGVAMSSNGGASNGAPSNRGMPFAQVESGGAIVGGVDRFARLFAEAAGDGATEVEAVGAGRWAAWFDAQSAAVQTWLRGSGKEKEPSKTTVLLIPNFDGEKVGSIRPVIARLEGGSGTVWAAAEVYGALPAKATYSITNLPEGVDASQFEIGWALGGYKYDRYKSKGKKKCTDGDSVSTLVRLTSGTDTVRVDAAVGASYLVRDLISTPTEDLGPGNLAKAAEALAERFDGATCTVVVGDDLLEETSYFPQVHIVGRAATPERAPRLIELRWNTGAEKSVTLVGKGVCYDTGGLSIKPTSGMLSMKKDMGGGAHVLGLGYMIMRTGLDVNLRVLVPAVENVVGPDSYRPGDVIVARNNLTTEVTNTDAEGRLVLADALVAACEENPSLVIDYATLTGAQRVALGPDIPSFWMENDQTAAILSECSEKEDDLMWRLPLHKPYRKKLDSSIADVMNCASGGYGGAITAALYLKEFVRDSCPWIHVDLMAFNPSSRPGRPEGGEAMGLRAMYAMLESMYKK